MIAIINSALAMVILWVGSIASYASQSAAPPVKCTLLCKRQYLKPSAGICTGWVVNFTPNPGSQDGGCKCHADWPWEDEECIVDIAALSCKVDVTVTVDSNTQTIWEKVQCNTGTPALWAWYCQQVGAPGNLYSRTLRCLSCGCNAHLNIEGYTQACGQVNSYSECNTPPDSPPSGFQCRFEISASCTSCNGGDC